MNQEYLTTTEILMICDISIRTYRYRLKKIRETIKEEKLILTENKKVMIHRSLVPLFSRKRNHSRRGRIFGTVAFLDRFSEGDLHQIMKYIYEEVKELYPDMYIEYVLEKHKNLKNHIHFISSSGNRLNEIKKQLNTLFKRFNVVTKNIYDINNLRSYITKDGGKINRLGIEDFL